MVFMSEGTSGLVKQVLRGYKSLLVNQCLVAVIVSVIFIMGGRVTLENDKIGGMPRELGRHGACGSSVSVFMGGERNITRQAGFMRNFIYHMEGDESTDIGRANWALMRAKTRFLKRFNLNQKE